MNLTMAMPQLISGLQSIKETQIFNSLGGVLDNIQKIGTLGSTGQIFNQGLDAAQQLDNLKNIIEVGDQAKAVLGDVIAAGGENSHVLLDLAKNGDEARKVLGEIGPALEKQVVAGEGANTVLGSLSGTMGKAMAAAAAEGATGLGIFGAGLKAVAIAAAEAIVPLLPFIAIGAAIAGVAFIIGQEAEKAEKVGLSVLTL